MGEVQSFRLNKHVDGFAKTQSRMGWIDLNGYEMNLDENGRNLYLMK